MSGTLDSYGGSMIGSNETVTASGSITAVFQWNGPNDDPPPTVVISMYSNAGFDVFNSGSPPSVSADNDIGDPNEYQTFVGGGVYQSVGGSFGHEYQIEQSGGTVTVVINPYISATGSGQVEVGYTLSLRLIEVELVLGGTTQISTADPPYDGILQGQKCPGQFVLDGADSFHGADLYLDDHNYNVPGNIFYGYTASTPQGLVHDFPPGHFQYPTLLWYWRGSPDLHQINYHRTETVSAAVNVYSADGELGEAFDQVSLEVYRPYYGFASTSGDVNWLTPLVPFRFEWCKGWPCRFPPSWYIWARNFRAIL